MDSEHEVLYISSATSTAAGTMVFRRSILFATCLHITVSTVCVLVFAARLVAQGNEGMVTQRAAWMEVADNPTIALPVFTAECWVKLGSGGLIVTRDHSTGTPSDWQLWYELANQRIAFITAQSPPDSYFFTPVNSVVPGRWYHFALVVDGPAGTAAVYIDGARVLSPTFTPRNFAASTGLAWGGYFNNNSGAYLSAQFDECRYWNHARSQAQIQAMKDRKLAQSERGGLHGYWMFCGNYADSSGMGNHGRARGPLSIDAVVGLPPALACSAQAAIILEAGSVTAFPGELVMIPVYLRSAPSDVLARVTLLRGQLRFNGTLLSPMPPASSFLQGRDRVVAYNAAPVLQPGSIIDSIPCIATLGDDTSTIIHLEGSVLSGVAADLVELPGRFTLRGVCRDGGVRLLDGSDTLQLRQNTPNPCNPSTRISFRLIEKGRSQLRVYDMLGRDVLCAFDADALPGEYVVDVDLSHCPSGLYVYSLSTPTSLLSRRLHLLR